MNTEILVPTLSGTSINIHKISKAKSDFIWDTHIHDECEFCMQIEGKKIFYINGKEYVVEKGDIIFVNENVPHQTKTFMDSSCFLMQCRAEYANTCTNENLSCYLNRAGVEFAIFKSKTEINNLLSECFTQIAEENEKENPFYDMFIKSNVIKVFAILFRHNILKDAVALFDEKSIIRILPAINYVEKHYFENITLDTVSKIMNVDKAHFCRIFKRATGTSFVQYLNFVRVQKAEKMLVETEKTVSEIAHEAGFSSPAYFAETFKSVMNCTPSSYRKIKTSE